MGSADLAGMDDMLRAAIQASAAGGHAVCLLHVMWVGSRLVESGEESFASSSYLRKVGRSPSLLLLLSFLRSVERTCIGQAVHCS